MAVKLHRCPNMWLKIDAHPCWRVQKALDEKEVEYEIVKHPVLRGSRDELERLTGQRKLPAVELADGRVIREESKQLAAKVRAGEIA
jgi:glutathione S-transferase